MCSQYCVAGSTTFSWRWKALLFLFFCAKVSSIQVIRGRKRNRKEIHVLKFQECRWESKETEKAPERKVDFLQKLQQPACRRRRASWAQNQDVERAISLGIRTFDTSSSSFQLDNTSFSISHQVVFKKKPLLVHYLGKLNKEGYHLGLCFFWSLKGI